MTTAFNEINNRDIMTNAALISSIATRSDNNWGVNASIPNGQDVIAGRTSMSSGHQVLRRGGASISTFTTTGETSASISSPRAGGGGKTSDMRSMLSGRSSSFASREHYRKLEELGMTGVLSLHQFLPQETSVAVISWLSQVVDGESIFLFSALCL